VFSELMRARCGHASRHAYSIYLTSGFIAWSLFAECSVDRWASSCTTPGC
jgi:ABC-type polysaccharide/polyol phosphate export permease